MHLLGYYYRMTTDGGIGVAYISSSKIYMTLRAKTARTIKRVCAVSILLRPILNGYKFTV
jgi:hypothetical protein